MAQCGYNVKEKIMGEIKCEWCDGSGKVVNAYGQTESCKCQEVGLPFDPFAKITGFLDDIENAIHQGSKTEDEDYEDL